MNQFCLDTNIFIEPWTKYYSMDICPDYWEILDSLAHKGIIFCTMEVKREIEKTSDDLSEWFKYRPHFFRELNDRVFINIRKIYENPVHERLVDNTKSRSLADPWVIAHAMAEQATVVTKEFLEARTTKRIKIPNICQNLGVPCIDEFEFIRTVGISFRAEIRKRI